MTREVALALTVLVSSPASLASAQTVETSRARVLVTGTPAGGARVDRVDVARSGLVSSRLPSVAIHAAWSVSAGAPVEQAPLVDAKGTVYVLTSRGDVIAIGRDGQEKWRVSTGAQELGPGALLSDDTIVTASAGDAVAVQAGHLRYKTRFARPDTVHPAPLPLDDGGAVLATSLDLVALDADGHERARVVLPEPTSSPLVSALGEVVAVTASGVIWGWVPGAPLSRKGTFETPIDGGAALTAMSRGRVLVAVTDHRTHLTSVDLTNGAVSTVAIAQGGSAWCGSPSIHGDAALLEGLSPAGEALIVLGLDGRELSRTLLVGATSAGADAGAPFDGARTTPVLVDSAGTVAFATGDGRFGVASPTAEGPLSVELLAGLCARGLLPRGPWPVSGLAPLGDDMFVVSCRSGALVAVAGGTHSQQGTTPARPAKWP